MDVSPFYSAEIIFSSTGNTVASQARDRLPHGSLVPAALYSVLQTKPGPSLSSLIFQERLPRRAVWIGSNDNNVTAFLFQFPLTVKGTSSSAMTSLCTVVPTLLPPQGGLLGKGLEMSL